MNMNDRLATEIIRERTSSRQATRKPTHPRTATVLRRLANRLDGSR